jgi:hypothetical protein
LRELSRVFACTPIEMNLHLQLIEAYHDDFDGLYQN